MLLCVHNIEVKQLLRIKYFLASCFFFVVRQEYFRKKRNISNKL